MGTGTPSRALTARAAPADWTSSSLGERMEHVCRLRKLSQNKLGELSGVDTGVISRLVQQRGVTGGSPMTLARVAKAAQVNLTWLVVGEGPVEPLEHSTGALGAQPEWPEALAEAKKRQRGIPEEFWALAAEVPLPLTRKLDWQIIVGLVRELYSHHQRHLQEEPATGWHGSDEPTGR
jgi:transcriptional regulator with XRE-family HTH domain